MTDNTASFDNPGPQDQTAGQPYDPVTTGAVLAGRYRLDTHVAKGGMGEVWKATDLELDRTVAVKLLHPHLGDDPIVVTRFRREARAAARLHHPAIVPVYDICSHGGRDAIVLQFIDGPTLRHYLDRVGILTDEQAVTVVSSVADALTVAHRAGIVHRDIKPANILFGPDRAMLTDFGVAKAVDDVDHTATGTLLGSVRYLSPEQVEGTATDGRSDIYSLGVVLYECVTGTTPWLGPNPTATALARLEGPLIPPGDHNPAVSPQLAAVITTCLARNPNDRFADATALRSALQSVEQSTLQSTLQSTPADVDATHHDGTDATSVIGSPAAEADNDHVDDDPFTRQPVGEGPFDDGPFDDDDEGVPPARVTPLRPLLPVLAVLAAVAVIVALLIDIDVVNTLLGR